MYSLSSTLTALKDQLLHRPVEIHDVYLGSQTAEDSNTLHFVNFYKTITFFSYIGHASTSYIPLSIGRSELKKTSTTEVERISYKVDNINRAMGAYAAAHDFRNKRIVTRLVFRDHLESYLDAKTIFDGNIQAIIFEGKVAGVTATPRLGTLTFETGWPYQLNCNAKFGDAYCKVNKETSANKMAGTATGGTTTTVIDTVLFTQVDDYWNWGTITFTSGDNEGISRKIVDYSAATQTLTLDYNLENAVAAGDGYTLYRGCDKMLNTCQTKYGNDVNFHGFHTIPLRK